MNKNDSPRPSSTRTLIHKDSRWVGLSHGRLFALIVTNARNNNDDDDYCDDGSAAAISTAITALLVFRFSDFRRSVLGLRLWCLAPKSPAVEPILALR